MGRFQTPFTWKVCLGDLLNKHANSLCHDVMCQSLGDRGQRGLANPDSYVFVDVFRPRRRVDRSIWHGSTASAAMTVTVVWEALLSIHHVKRRARYKCDTIMSLREKGSIATNSQCFYSDRKREDGPTARARRSCDLSNCIKFIAKLLFLWRRGSRVTESPF